VAAVSSALTGKIGAGGDGYSWQAPTSWRTPILDRNLNPGTDPTRCPAAHALQPAVDSDSMLAHCRGRGVPGARAVPREPLNERCASARPLAATITGRPDALAHAHARFNQSNLTAVRLRELVKDELRRPRPDAPALGGRRQEQRQAGDSATTTGSRRAAVRLPCPEQRYERKLREPPWWAGRRQRGEVRRHHSEIGLRRNARSCEWGWLPHTHAIIVVTERPDVLR
jgi:hypothetical protein